MCSTLTYRAPFMVALCTWIWWWHFLIVVVMCAVITGPNCSGKSTYMKSLAIIVILAHMGSFVPATQAFISLRDRICTRFGTSDDMEEYAGTFAVEMTETNFILETATVRSLVLIDELGRGTACDEGFAIAWSVSEELIRRRTFTCFTTHFNGANTLSSLYSNCRCYHMTATSGQVSFSSCAVDSNH